MGPLEGIRIIEFSAIGPVPFAAMLLSDMGAEVIRIDRKPAPTPRNTEIYFRGRPVVSLDLKKPGAAEAALKLIEKAEAIMEGFRPGVMERLGLSPDICLARNPRLVYGRMTGWGQTGPLAHAAGHDINYIALSGALHAIGQQGGKPIPPLNLVGDFGGGALYLAFGVICGILQARHSGKGQVVDAAMIDGAASLMSVFYGMYAAGFWQDARGVNLLDSGAPFYDTYQTKDGKWVALGPLEPEFYGALLEKLGMADADSGTRLDRTRWPKEKERIAATIKTRTRDEWDAVLLGSDVCYAPVLSLAEAPRHPHNVARGVFIEVGGVTQPAPAPRFSGTPAESPGPPRGPDSEAVLKDWGFSGDEIERLKSSDAIA
ncbi:MAG TPA: CaiB/BaiF CoA-transferase family protein [Rhizomicrobium sp.]|jgi:alpha-methylacyl-CoA racemase|nr:CaiB/BaiF CoA-transferase family protein [Rhizomicrobium sp.]